MLFRSLRRNPPTIFYRTFCKECPFKVLGVSPTISKKDLKAHFKVLAKKYHPDLDPSNKTRFISILQAYSDASTQLTSGKSTDLSSSSSPSPSPVKDDPLYTWLRSCYSKAPPARPAPGSGSESGSASEEGVSSVNEIVLLGALCAVVVLGKAFFDLSSREVPQQSKEMNIRKIKKRKRLTHEQCQQIGIQRLELMDDRGEISVTPTWANEIEKFRRESGVRDERMRKERSKREEEEQKRKKEDNFVNISKYKSTS